MHLRNTFTPVGKLTLLRSPVKSRFMRAAKSEAS